MTISLCHFCHGLFLLTGIHTTSSGEISKAVSSENDAIAALKAEGGGRGKEEGQWNECLEFIDGRGRTDWLTTELKFISADRETDNWWDKTAIYSEIWPRRNRKRRRSRRRSSKQSERSQWDISFLNEAWRNCFFPSSFLPHPALPWRNDTAVA